MTDWQTNQFIYRMLFIKNQQYILNSSRENHIPLYHYGRTDRPSEFPTIIFLLIYLSLAKNLDMNFKNLGLEL